MSWMFAVGCGNGDDDDDNVTDAGKDGTAPTLDATSSGDDDTNDAGGDATTTDASKLDSGADTGVLGTTDGGKDGSADAGDAGDAESDAGEDAGPDSGVDAGVLPLFTTVGRWASPTATTLSAAWPGSGLTVTFTGPTLQLSITDAPIQPAPVAKNANSNNVSGASGTDYLVVYIDDTPAKPATPTVVQITATAATPTAKTTIYSNGTTGTHTAKIYKATDADIGTITVTVGAAGNVPNTPFTVQNTYAVVPAASPFTTRIEFIGDEQTAGWGDGAACTVDSSANLTSTSNDENAAVPGLVAEYFNAARVTTANFQLGLDQNAYYAGDDLLSNYYGKTLPYMDATATWDFTKFVPQAVVVNIGSLTDLPALSAGVTGTPPVPFATGLATFQTDLGAFLTKVKTQYTVNGKGPYIAVVSGPEYGYGATDAQIASFKSAVAAALTASGATGSAIVAPSYSSGCNGYPDAAANAATAKAIEDALGTTLGKTGP